MRRSSYRRLAKKFARHRHRITKSMRGFTSIPVRFRGRRL